MPTDPSNDRFDVPVPYNEGPYDEYVNNNFDTLAVEVPDSGPIPDRPAAGNEFAPDRYYATDEGIEYYNTGGTWEVLLSGAALALPGEIQQKIDAVAGSAGGTVLLDSTKVYDEGTEIHVKPHVTLDCLNARLEITGNHNGVFLDQGARLLNADIRVTASGAYDGDAVVLDVARAGKYGIQQDARTTVTGYIEHSGHFGQGETRESTGLALYPNSQGNGADGIGLGCTFDVAIYGFGIGIHGGPNGWVNAPDFTVDVQNCGTHLLIEGAFNSEVRGAFQPAGGSKYGIRTLPGSTTGSFIFIGSLWDSGNYDTAALDGENITVMGPINWSLVDNVSGDANQMGIMWRRGQMELMDFERGRRWQWDLTDQGVAFGEQGSVTYEVFDYDNNLITAQGADFHTQPRDLSTETPSIAGIIAVHDGSGTGGAIEVAVSQGDGSWLTMSGATL
jgi:hypothetical protein